MKKAMVCILVVFVVLTSILSSVAYSSSENNKAMPEKTEQYYSPTFSIDCISIEDDDYKAHNGLVSIAVEYGDNDEEYGMEGPTDYEVVDSRYLLVLDPLSKKIQKYDMEKGLWIGSVDLSYCKYPEKLEYSDETYYVYDTESMAIYIVSYEGGLVDTIALPTVDPMDYEDQDAYIDHWTSLYTADLKTIDGTVYLITGRAESVRNKDYFICDSKLIPCEPKFKYELDNNDVLTISYDEYHWTFPGENLGVDVLGVDETGNLCVYCVEWTHDDQGYVHIVESIRKYDANNTLTGAVYFDSTEDFDVFLINPAKWMSSNSAYYFAGTSDSMIISIISLSSEIVNSKDTVRLSEEYSERSPMEIVTTTLPPATNTRSQAYSLSQQYVNYEYNVSSKNKHAWNDCKLHSHIINAQYSVPVKGVPYARGRMDSIATINTRKTQYYNGSTSYYYCAGNINRSQDVPGTANFNGAFGVDCSGYASRAYGFSSHVHSSTFMNGYTCSPRRRMDCYACDGHVILFVSAGDTSTSFVCYEASRVSAGKVRTHSYAYTTMVNDGYVLRNPWHSGSCTYPGYQYNASKHWRVCSVCGYQTSKDDHNLVLQYNSTEQWYECTTCHYETEHEAFPLN
jgi:hypothetical protein